MKAVYAPETVEELRALITVVNNEHWTIEHAFAIGSDDAFGTAVIVLVENHKDEPPRPLFGPAPTVRLMLTEAQRQRFIASRIPYSTDNEPLYVAGRAAGMSTPPVIVTRYTIALADVENAIAAVGAVLANFVLARNNNDVPSIFPVF